MRPDAQGLYPKETIASLLDITERRVEQLAKDWIIPKAGRGLFDLRATVNAYVRYLHGFRIGGRERERDELDQRMAEARVKEREEKARQAKCRADAMELAHGLIAQDVPRKLAARFPDPAVRADVERETASLLRDMLERGTT
ncbi:MAG: hypothetical protein IJR14_06395 [Synergistaceae bacterium]|nr:hypothetical protein [Synergistaceae bacterium]